MSDALNTDRIVEFYEPCSGSLGPGVNMPEKLLAVVRSFDGKQATVRVAMEAFQQSEPSATVYDQGDWIAIGIGERVPVIPGVTLHQHNYQAIRMRAVRSAGFFGLEESFDIPYHSMPLPVRCPFCAAIVDVPVEKSLGSVGTVYRCVSQVACQQCQATLHTESLHRDGQTVPCAAYVEHAEITRSFIAFNDASSMESVQ